MKAIKINMSDHSTKGFVKGAVAGVAVSIAVTIAVTLILSLIITIAGNLFEQLTPYIMLLPLIAGSYAGGYTSARIARSNGLLWGLGVSALIFIILLIISFATGQTEFSYMFIIKLACLILPGAVGGIKGVNKKEKLKI